MSLPISRAWAPAFVAACMAVAACDDGRSGDVPFGEDEQASEDNRQIECALDGATAFARECTRTLIPNEAGDQLIIEGPDGSFRRFVILTDGRGLEAADGAENPVISIRGDDRIEVTIAGDRYLLPARMRGESTDVPAEAP